MTLTASISENTRPRASAGANQANTTSATPFYVISPAEFWTELRPRALWHYRELGLILALRDIQVRYKQTLLGVAWAVLQPLVAMIVLAMVFGRLLGVAQSTGPVPYPIFLYAGLLPWTLFASCVNAASTSLVGNTGMLQKVYFPRLLLPLSAVGAPLLDFLLATVVLAGMMLWYHLSWHAGLLLLPLATCTLLLTAWGVGTLLAAVTVTYRDVRHVLPFVMQVWFFLTPVILPASALPPKLQRLLWLNPVGGSIEIFRGVILGQPVAAATWLGSTLGALVCVTLGLLWFNRTSRQFADVI